MLEGHGDEGEHAPSGEVSLLRSRKHAARRKTRLTIGGSPDGLEEREKERDGRTHASLVVCNFCCSCNLVSSKDVQISLCHVAEDQDSRTGTEWLRCGCGRGGH